MIVDDEWITIGSANTDRDGFEASTEFDLGITSSKLAQQLRVRLWTVLPFENGAQVISDRLVELAKINPDPRVLDIATGIGESAITATTKIRNGNGCGHVLATDMSSQMLSIAKQRAISWPTGCD